MNQWLIKQENKLTLVLIIFYLVGLLGLWLNPTLFIKLTPYNLLLTTFLLFKLHPEKDTLFYSNLFLVFIAAWFLEMMGVQSGQIFGVYQYGESLGIKLNQTPVIIGLNWIIVAYSSIQMVQKIATHFQKKISEIGGAALAASAMLLLDLLIEPIAPSLDFWSWQGGQIPLQNYTAWFFFGFSFCYWMLKGGLLKNNPMGWRVYLTQFVFFICLNLLHI